MNRYLPLTLLLIIGCAAAQGDNRKFEFGKVPTAKSAAPLVKDDPQPTPQPTPVPTPDPQPIPQPTPKVEEPDLSLPAELSGDVGAFIRIKATTNGKEVRWMALDKGLTVFPPEDMKDNRRAVVLAIVPGQYRLLAYTCLADVPSDPVVCSITIRGPPAPQPTPQPVPQPNPQPQPIPPSPTPAPQPVQVRNLWILTIDDSNARSQQLNDILTDQATWHGFNVQGHKWGNYNKTNTKIMNDYAPMIQMNGGLPTIVIIDQTSKVWLNNNPADLKVPATLEGLKALIFKYAGK